MSCIQLYTLWAAHTNKRLVSARQTICDTAVMIPECTGITLHPVDHIACTSALFRWLGLPAFCTVVVTIGTAQHIDNKDIVVLEIVVVIVLNLYLLQFLVFWLNDNSVLLKILLFVPYVMKCLCYVFICSSTNEFCHSHMPSWFSPNCMTQQSPESLQIFAA